MNKRIDFSKLGGYPLAQEDLDWLQQSYQGAFAAIAGMVGDKVIISGMTEGGGNVTNGWISIASEIVPFAAGAIGTGAYIIEETKTALVFNDGISNDVIITRQARFSAGGPYLYSELRRLNSIINYWLPGDIKEKICDAPYMAANFDVNGFGINKEFGWRILSKALPATAGKVMVNHDPANAPFNVLANTGGEVSHVLLGAEQGKFTVAAKSDDLINAVGGGGVAHVRVRFNGVEVPDGSSNAGAFGANTTVTLNETAAPHNILQPYYVVLKLIKL